MTTSVQTLEEQIVALAKGLQTENKKSETYNLPFYDGLVHKKGNKYFKSISPITLQRNSFERAVGDIFRTYFLQKDSLGRYVLYDHDEANRGNMIIVPTNDFVDCFGNYIEAWKPLQMNGNTLVILLTQILNGLVPLPKNCTFDKGRLVPQPNSTLKYEIVLVANNDEYQRIYYTIDNSSASKSKPDNYTSVLGGYGLLDVMTGESDLVKWVQTGMDRVISLIDNEIVPKKVECMAGAVKPYLESIKNVHPDTTYIVQDSKNWNAVFRALCIDMTEYTRRNVSYQYRYTQFLTQLKEQIVEILDSNVEDYWQKRLFPSTRKSNGDSLIDWGGDKDIYKWVRHGEASVFKLQFKPIDWINWELFSLTNNAGDSIKEHQIYVKGGSDILSGDQRTENMYKELNFLRLVFLHAMHEGIDKRISIEDLIDWASDFDFNGNKFPKDCYTTQVSHLIQLGSIRTKGRCLALRQVLKNYIYS